MSKSKSTFVSSVLFCKGNAKRSRHHPDMESFSPVHSVQVFSFPSFWPAVDFGIADMPCRCSGMRKSGFSGAGSPSWQTIRENSLASLGSPFGKRTSTLCPPGCDHVRARLGLRGRGSGFYALLSAEAKGTDRAKTKQHSINVTIPV